MRWPSVVESCSAGLQLFRRVVVYSKWKQRKMSERQNNNNWGYILSAAAGIGAAAYIISKSLSEVPLTANGAEPRRYEDPCPWQTPQKKRITYVVETMAECKYATNIIKQHCESYRVLGFDIEFGYSREIALLQLATHEGVCVLIRLCRLSRLPDELSQILADPRIIKVGVGSYKDAVDLSREEIDVNGTLDLRFVAKAMNVAGSGNLREMTKKVLGRLLVAGGNHNWSAEALTKRHVDYAAEDALAGVEIFKKFERDYINSGGFFEFRDTDSFLEKFRINIDKYCNLYT